ncbi:hypothetical protein HO133_009393 [Letharia lupina]|uniref:Uncharacterized protein n=1 Tax=Letharia lupina TaxID=560253 RepID=A0A8H6CN89_9LECA|nr:uncharacterized protein HO133_009393 [Letharia lupina]KAF6226527.1 hypothetical protein HO133_009393 [Letharia lupina]
MATAHQPARPAQRMSSGKDILSRMLQMEKQSKQQRSSSAGPTIPLSLKRTSFSGPSDQASPSAKTTPKSPLPTPQPSQRPSLTTRSQTLPSLLTDRGPSGKSMPSLAQLKTNTSTDQEDSTPIEICLSPSWSDHGEKRKRREKKRMEKEQKEIEKRLKQDQERQRTADIKAGKRLSRKPPPAAMETQKMPQALRRNSWASMMSSHTSSGENTRRSSREEKRLSGISIGSTGSQSHSRSTPATSTEEASDPARRSGQSHSVISSAAPKIPNFGWSSRRTSSGTNKSLSWGSEDAYAREVISFAYRFEGSPTDLEHPKPNELEAQQGSKPPIQQAAITPTFSRSVTEPNLATFSQQSVPRSPQRPPAKRKDSSEPRQNHGQKDPPGERRNSAHSPKASPNFQDDLAGEMEAIMASHHQRPSQNPPSPRSPQTRSSHDGSSYVHKQRMYQQQRSIAGFEDEQAVKDANDMAAKSEALAGEDGQRAKLGLRAPDTRQQHSNTVSVTPGIANDRVPVSPMTRDSAMQPDIKLSPMKQQTPVKQQTDVAPSSSLKPAHTNTTQKGPDDTEIRAGSQLVRDSVSLNKTQTAPGLKTDKILNFRRRSKLAPSKISVPDNVQSKTVALPSVPPTVTIVEEPPGKRSKAERMSQDTKPTQVHASVRTGSESSPRSPPRESLPEPNPMQSHAKSRTSSSMVLSDNLPSPTSPKSTTEPVVMSSNKAAKQAEGNEASRELHLEAELKSPHGKRMTSVTTNKALPDTPPAAKDASAPEATTSKAIPTTKPLPEVVIESTTEEGLVRKTSIKRPRSNPQLQTQTTATNSLPSLDFLPQLKHQPLVKRQPQFLPVAKDRFPPVPKDYATIKLMASKPPVSSHAPDMELIPRSPFRTPSQFPVPGRTFNRSVTDVGTVSFGKGALAEGMEAKPIAKLFVICCKCKFWHDLPSKLYEAMALPKELHKDENLAGDKGKGKVTGTRLETAVKCPWCEHAMTTWCCQGWTTVVYLHERHH